MSLDADTPAAVKALATALDRFAGRYRQRTGATDFGAYIATPQRTDDEEVLTEPILAAILEEVLGFPTDRYFPQLTKSGSKPDFTPVDLVAHPFVLDAKSSAIADLDAHEAQIRRYIDLEMIRRAEPWRQREARGEPLVIDIEYLVDRLRDLSLVLASDAAAQDDAIDRELRLDPDLEPALVAELRTLANDLEPGVRPGELPETVAAFHDGDGLAARVWRQYLLRVSQLALIRIVLYRSWEDAGFVTERLYNGGFGVLFEQLGRRLSDVLEAAFSAGRDRYPWLYGGGSSYDWYRPSDDTLAEVLYTLLPVPLGKLDADVLGGLYESYVDEIDRDRLGQFYTPRSVVRFMLDRVGFTSERGLFDVEGDRRTPPVRLDEAVRTRDGGHARPATRAVAAGRERDPCRHERPTLPRPPDPRDRARGRTGGRKGTARRRAPAAGPERAPGGDGAPR